MDQPLQLIAVTAYARCSSYSHTVVAARIAFAGLEPISASSDKLAESVIEI